MISLNKVHIRPCPGHTHYMPVFFFSKNNSYLTVPYNKQKNVLITTNNENIVKELTTVDLNCHTHAFPVLVPRALSEEMGIDMVIVSNTYCEIDTREVVYELYYVVPAKLPVTIARSRLLEQEHQ